MSFSFSTVFWLSLFLYSIMVSLAFIRSNDQIPTNIYAERVLWWKYTPSYYSIVITKILRVHFKGPGVGRDLFNKVCLEMSPRSLFIYVRDLQRSLFFSFHVFPLFLFPILSSPPIPLSTLSPPPHPLIHPVSPFSRISLNPWKRVHGDLSS